jgi:hypothetical protein
MVRFGHVLFWRGDETVLLHWEPSAMISWISANISGVWERHCLMFWKAILSEKLPACSRILLNFRLDPEMHLQLHCGVGSIQVASIWISEPRLLWVGGGGVDLILRISRGVSMWN